MTELGEGRYLHEILDPPSRYRAERYEVLSRKNHKDGSFSLRVKYVGAVLVLDEDESKTIVAELANLLEEAGKALKSDD